MSMSYQLDTALPRTGEELVAVEERVSKIEKRRMVQKYSPLPVVPLGALLSVPATRREAPRSKRRKDHIRSPVCVDVRKKEESPV